MPLLRDVALVIAEPHQSGLELIRGAAGERGEVRVADQPLDQPTMLVDP